MRKLLLWIDGASAARGRLQQGPGEAALKAADEAIAKVAPTPRSSCPTSSKR